MPFMFSFKALSAFLLIFLFQVLVLLNSSQASPILYYNFEQVGSSVDQVGSANVTWGSGGSAHASSPLGDTLGSSFSSTSSDSVAPQLSIPAIGTGDFSISFWMNLPSSYRGDGTANGVLDMLNGSTGGGLQVLISPNDQIALGVGAGSFQNRFSTVALAAGNFGTWTHIAITVDRDNAGGITYYVNGAQLGGTQNPTAYLGTSIAANQNLQIGSANSLSFFGLIDDLALYSVVLTPTEVSSLADGSQTPLTVIEPPNNTPPAAPTGVVAISSSYKVDLSWTVNTEPDVNTYLIYRKEGSGSFRLIGSTSTTQYTDRAFTSGVQYTYHVVAVNISGLESPASTEVVGTFSPPSAIDLSASPDKPNIILVMADDQGWGDAGYNGHPFVQTPAMDAMAEDGFVLNRFYAAAPVCSPTRASVMTGRHPIRCKVPQHGRYMRVQEMTIAEALKSAGYVTGIFGKLHLGSGQPDSPANPSAMGFDEWLIGLNFFDNNPYLSRNGVVEHASGKGSDITIDETISFVDSHKNTGKPIFAIAWFPSPHDPHAEVPDGPSLYNGESQAGYYREITLLDEGLGRLRQYLRDQNIEQNTILWYSSDNGGLNGATSGGRGQKTHVYEGGLRVPGIIEWPARGLKGASNVPISTSDMYPTLLSMAGVIMENQLPLDGEDVTGILEGSTASRGSIGFWHNFQGGQATFSDNVLQAVMVKQQNGDPTPHDAPRIKKDIDEFPQFAETTSPGHAAWLSWPWKLHRINGSTYELYHLESDPMEAANLAGMPEHSARLATMQSELHTWQQSVVRSINGSDYGQVPLWLPFNRTRGLEFYDANGERRGDLLNFQDNTAHWMKGKHNMSVLFDGVNDQAIVENPTYYPPVGENDRTVTCWIRTTGDGLISSWGDPNLSGGEWNISVSASGVLSLDVNGGSINGTTDLRDNTWHHIAVVMPNDGSPDTNEVIFYVDGLVETISSSVLQAIRTGNSPVVIGGVRGGSITIDEYRISPWAFTASEVQAEFSAVDQGIEAWLYEHEIMSPVDWTSDADGDGLTLLEEYAYGHDPLVHDESTRSPCVIYDSSRKRLELVVTQRLGMTHDIEYFPEVSENLKDWVIPFAEESSIDHPDLDQGLFELKRYRDDVPLENAEKLFMRMRVRR